VIYYDQALALCRELGKASCEAATLGNMGMAYEGLSEYDQALECFAQSLPLHEQDGDLVGQAAVINNRGSCT